VKSETEIQGADDLRKRWPERMARVREVWARVDVTGMTRPCRDAGERRFLERTGQSPGPFKEVELPTPSGKPPWSDE
jgi:hypothetical protein